jgi:ABC-type sugar transport system ATPase subunit
LVGAGRTEFVKTLFAYEKMESGEVYIEGKRVKLHSPKDAIKKGLALVTEDRKQEGLALKLSVKENIMSSNLDQVTGALSLVKEKKEAQIAKEGIEKLSVKTPSENFIVNNLSGGNQQKVILAKWLAGHPKILILDEPTRGIDVGAKAEIYHIMHSLVKQGISILMISSEMPEIIGMSDRIAVMREGVITGVLENVELTQEKILTLATGGM